MTLLTILILLATIAASLVASAKLPQADRLPMNWGLTSRPTWSAPRRVALSFTPVLAVLTTGFMMLIAPRDAASAALVAAAFLAAHLLHIWLIKRELDRD